MIPGEFPRVHWKSRNYVPLTLQLVFYSKCMTSSIAIDHLEYSTQKDSLENDMIHTIKGFLDIHVNYVNLWVMSHGFGRVYAGAVHTVPLHHHQGNVCDIRRNTLYLISEISESRILSLSYGSVVCTISRFIDKGC